jgi:hypothetical protein
MVESYIIDEQYTTLLQELAIDINNSVITHC